jgi:hypothetical protein
MESRRDSIPEPAIATSPSCMLSLPPSPPPLPPSPPPWSASHRGGGAEAKASMPAIGHVHHAHGPHMSERRGFGVRGTSEKPASARCGSQRARRARASVQSPRTRIRSVCVTALLPPAWLAGLRVQGSRIWLDPTAGAGFDGQRLGPCLIPSLRRIRVVPRRLLVPCVLGAAAQCHAQEGACGRGRWAASRSQQAREAAHARQRKRRAVRHQEEHADYGDATGRTHSLAHPRHLSQIRVRLRGRRELAAVSRLRGRRELEVPCKDFVLCYSVNSVFTAGGPFHIDHERTVGRTAVVTMSGLSDVPIAFPTLPGCLQCRI